MNPKKRIFVLDNSVIVKEVIAPTIESIGIKPNLEITYCYDKRRLKFPSNYDAYLIHVSHTSLTALEDLKKQEPWSVVIGRTTMPNEHLNWDIKDKIDGWYDGFNYTTEKLREVLSKLEVIAE